MSALPRFWVEVFATSLAIPSAPAVFAKASSEQVIVGMSMTNLLSLEVLVVGPVQDLKRSIVPALAQHENEPFSDDRKTFIFDLHKGSSLLSGSPLTAEDVARSSWHLISANESVGVTKARVQAADNVILFPAVHNNQGHAAPRARD